MLGAIKGYYDQGKIILKEVPPVTEKTNVIVTFLPENSFANDKQVNTREKKEIILSIPPIYNINGNSREYENTDNR